MLLWKNEGRKENCNLHLTAGPTYQHKKAVLKIEFQKLNSRM